jgi:predicted PurR-regulated permease PerM
MLIAAAIVVGMLLIWHLAGVLLLVFGAVLIGVLLRGGGDLIRRWLPLSERAAVGVCAFLIAALLTGFFLLLGSQIWVQATDLLNDLPELVAAVERRLGVSGIEGWLEENLGEAFGGGELAASITSFSSAAVNVIGQSVLVLVGGIYLALTPRLYRDGLLKLIAPECRAKSGEALDAVGGALRLWLVGQLLAMLLVGILTTTGLWLLGIPSALALGFVAALLDFVPIVGPLLAAIPAVALGLADGATTALWVAGLYLLIQQIEGNVIMPLVQQQAVELPPALTIFAIVAFGVLFGTLGVLFATPLAVACFVLVKLLWVRDTLGEETHIPGEEETGA